MADQLDINRLTAFDASGDPLSGAKAYFFESGTSTPVTVYSDAALSVAHPSPLVADSSGVFAPVFYGDASAVKVRVDTSGDVEVYTTDPVRRVTGEGAAAASVSFAPTTEIPVNTVQAAIERVQANASITFNVIEKTAGYTVVAADKTKLIRCTAALTLTMTAAATLGDGFFFAVEADGGAVTITGVGSLADGEWGLIWCDGSNFFLNKSPGPLEQTDWNTGTSTVEAKISPAKLQAKLENGFYRATAQASTSGTAIDFTGIPAAAKRITVMMAGVSLSGSDALLIQLGDAGGFETSSYTSRGSGISGSASTVASTAGMIIPAPGATDNVSGQMVLTRLDGNVWVQSGCFALATATQQNLTSGTKTLSDELTQLRVTATGSDTFDAGSINILVEL